MKNESPPSILEAQEPGPRVAASHDAPYTERNTRLQVCDVLTENYADYYERENDLEEWRRLGATDKCANITRLCSSLEHRSVLEIGCGEGAILERLARLGFSSRFTGLEISASALRRVRQKNIPGVEAHLFDGYELPWPERSFDLAILSHVIEHVEYPRKLICEAARAARDVFVEVPLEDNARLPRDFMFDRVGHINFYNSKTIRHLVQSCGMQITGAVVSHNSLPGYIYRKGKWRGFSSYLVKDLALKLWPSIATKFFTYNYSLTFKRNQR